jgi:hypothetical protein
MLGIKLIIRGIAAVKVGASVYTVTVKVEVDWRPCGSVSTTVTGKIPVWLGRVGAKPNDVPEITVMKDEREAG